MIDILFFSHNRLDFFESIFFFVKKIKKENQKKINFTILTTDEHVEFFKKFNVDLIFNYKIIPFKSGFNYTSKLQYATNSKSDYSIKIDEDCLINNHIWDYMIENTSVLDNSDNLLISPMLSTSIPSCDDFIENFLNDEEKTIIYDIFLKQKMPNGLFNVNYEPLNEHTIHSTKWLPEKYYESLEKLPTKTKGMHPLRISYEGQITLNNMIVKNFDSLNEKKNYELYEINSPYFTINMFMMKTSTWKTIVDSYKEVYDEIPISNYKRDNNKKFLFISNGFGIHTMYNTVYGNKNRWGIGGENGDIDEANFIKQLNEKIL